MDKIIGFIVDSMDTQTDSPNLPHNIALAVLDNLRSNLAFTYPQETNLWLNDVAFVIQDSIDRWRLRKVELVKGGTLGLVIRAFSDTYDTQVIVKIIPPFLNRFESELSAYQMLSSKYLCRMYDYIPKEGVLLLECLNPGCSFVFERDILKLKKYFVEFYNYTIACQKCSCFSFRDFYNEKWQLASLQTFQLNKRTYYKTIADRLIENIFASSQCYNLHGDLHSGNLLWSHDTLIAIDPLGFSAPIEFMFSRFTLFQFIECDDWHGCMERMIDFLSFAISDINRFLYALIIDCELCIETGVVQLNDNYIMASKFLGIMEFLLDYCDAYKGVL